MTSALIAYYTQTKTTKEISEYISKKLVAKKMEVTIKPIDHITDMSYYDLIIIGTPIHGMRIDENTKNFLDKHKNLLKKKQVGLFYTSYLLGNGRKFWQRAIKNCYSQYDKSIQPLAIGGFFGRVDKHFTGLPKFLLGPKDSEPLDRRDWTQVDRFIDHISA